MVYVTMTAGYPLAAGSRCRCGGRAAYEFAGAPRCDACARAELYAQFAHEARAHAGRFARYRRAGYELVCLSCAEALPDG